MSTSPSLLTSPQVPARTGRLGLLEQRRFRRLERRIERIDDDERLAVLKALARESAIVQAIEPTDARSRRGHLSGPVVLRVGERRLGLSRVQAAVWETLRQATNDGEITLVGAGRYGNYWVLQFAGPGAPLAVLAERVRLLPDAGEAVDPADARLSLAS